jgi:hypothetical protein
MRSGQFDADNTAKSLFQEGLGVQEKDLGPSGRPVKAEQSSIARFTPDSLYTA